MIATKDSEKEEHEEQEEQEQDQEEEQEEKQEEEEEEEGTRRSEVSSGSGGRCGRESQLKKKVVVAEQPSESGTRKASMPQMKAVRCTLYCAARAGRRSNRTQNKNTNYEYTVHNW